MSACSVVAGTVWVTLVISRLHAFRQRWRFLRLMLRKTTVTVAMLGVVWIVALGTDKPALGAGAGPFANSFAVNAFSPVPINLAVALAAQLLWLVETDWLVTMINQLVAVSGMKVNQTPDVAASVWQFG